MASYSTQQKLAAWLVHFYTISGGVFALFGLYEALSGRIEEGFLLLIIAYWIDGTDGLLARAVKVWDVLPNFSGELIDHLIDFFSYIWIPAIIMWDQKLLPHVAWTALPVIASLYSYGISTKTDDSFFQGFPSLWNVILIYLYYLNPAPLPAILMILIPALLIFIPFKYLYPSKNPFLSKPTWALTLIWLALWFYILLVDQDIRLVQVSLFFPIYYFVASLYATYQFGKPK